LAISFSERVKFFLAALAALREIVLSGR
jgi:hypothetical protein